MTALFIKILSICLITAVLNSVLKPKSGEYAFLLTVISGVILLSMILNVVVSSVKSFSDKMVSLGVNSEYFKISLKALGIAYISDFFADSCRDMGQTSLASAAELAGKAAIFLLSIPLLNGLIEIASGFIK